MKAPDFIKIFQEYWGHDRKALAKLKEGDKIDLCFGEKRTRTTTYTVKHAHRNDDKALYSLTLVRSRD